METETEAITTRIPAFLWSSLQDVFFEFDYTFLKTIAPHIGVPIADLKRTILGTRGEATRIVVAKEDKWWEGTLCPLKVRNDAGLWVSCCEFREPHGVCHKHKGWIPGESIRHGRDTWFDTMPRWVPIKWEGETVWVAEDTTVYYDDGTMINDLYIDPVSGIRICD